ncbi:MAG: hypothetical protein HGA19_18650, partial [Oscillochloris sp.]|nr:hypothetical protein [Oscillochloris sp.]
MERLSARRDRGARHLLPGVYVFLSLLLWIVAYQVPARLNLAIGGDSIHQRRFDENPFLHQINSSEPPDRAACLDDPTRQCWWWQVLAPGKQPYRWTTGTTSAEIPGIGGGLYVVTIMASGQPSGMSTSSTWHVGAASPLTIDLPPGKIRRYHILAPATSAGDLQISMQTQPYPAPGDPRELGFVLYELRMAQAGNGPRAPAWPQLGWLALTLAATYGVARMLSVGPRTSAAFTLFLGMAITLALALARPAITIFTPILVSIALAIAVISAVAWVATRRLGSATPFVRQVIALALLAFALRVGGMLHPHAIYSDSKFHANNLFSLTLGQVFQTAGLPSEAGGGQAPYPVGAYLLLLPGQLFVAAEARVVLMQVGTAALDSLIMPLIALLTIRAGLGRCAALMGAACYLLPVTALETLARGELANIGGQSIALGFVALLALGILRTAHTDRHLSSNQIALATAALTAGLLAHSGVTLSLGAFTAAAWLITLAQRATGRTSQPISLLQLTLSATLALGAALLIYYSAPIYVESILSRAESSGQGVTTHVGLAPLSILSETIGGMFGLLPPRSRTWPLPPLLGVLAT